MTHRFIKKYLYIIFITVTFMNGLHHHDDIIQHVDCQMCVVQNTLSDFDTPLDVFYLSKITLSPKNILSQYQTLHSLKPFTTLHERAPPYNI